MSEPKFSDAPCYGKDYDATSRICRVCLANKSCQRKVYKLLGVSQARGLSILSQVRRPKPQPQTVLT
jgi:hypothetical protein